MGPAALLGRALLSAPPSGLVRSGWSGARSQMTTPDAVQFPVVVSAGSDRLHVAMEAFLSRYKGQSRVHAESDLRAYPTWCLERGADPLQVSRPQVELYVRWMQEIRRFKPSTVSRRLSVMTGFYRTCVIDAVLPSSPAEHVRRPNVPPESPTPRADPPAFRSDTHRRPGLK